MSFEPTAGGPKRPTGDQLAALAAGAEADLAAVLEALPFMALERVARRRAEDGGGHAPGGHSDPTGDRAFRTTPADRWLRSVLPALAALQTAATQVDGILGPASCPECLEPLSGRPVRILDGHRYHLDRCWINAYRRKKRAETS